MNTDFSGEQEIDQLHESENISLSSDLWNFFQGSSEQAALTLTNYLPEEDIDTSSGPLNYDSQSKNNRSQWNIIQDFIQDSYQQETDMVVHYDEQDLKTDHYGHVYDQSQQINVPGNCIQQTHFTDAYSQPISEQKKRRAYVKGNSVNDGTIKKITPNERKQTSIIQQKTIQKTTAGGGTKWNEYEDQLLIKYQKIYCGNWCQICKQIEGRNASQCFQRWRRMFPPNRKQYPSFSLSIDAFIIDRVKTYGHQWTQISQYLPQYKPKQIRDRYVLDEKINKTEFTKDEDQQIINLYNKFGAKWKLIALSLNGRNDNDVKNRFYTKLRRQFFGIENRYQTVYKPKQIPQ